LDYKKYSLYLGLSNVTYCEADYSKAPATLNNLTRLKEYYSKYKSDKDMK
jgi:hypothetical protein